MFATLYKILKKIDIVTSEALFGDDQYFEVCKRIIFVPGIDMHTFKMRWWKEDLERAFPQCELIMFDAFYFHTQHERVASFCESLGSILADDVPTVVIAHSFGGMVAKKAIENITEKKNITLFVTMATPHTMEKGGVREACNALKIPDKVSVPTITFGGVYDIIVPEKYTSMEGAREHLILPCVHVSFLYARAIRARVIKKIQEQLHTA